MGWLTPSRGGRFDLSPTAVVLALVHSNLVISLAATSVAVTTAILVGLPLEPTPLFIVFAATMFVYSLNRITDLPEDATNLPGRTSYVRTYGRFWLAASAALYLLATGLAIGWNLPRAEYMGLPLVVALVYSRYGAKRVFLVKNLLVGASWGVIPLGLATYYRHPLSVEVVVLAGYVCAMITIAAVVFDIKDIEGDREAGIRTVPVAYGPRWTRISAAVGNVLVGLLVVGFVWTDVLGGEYLVLLAFSAYVGAYIPYAVPERTPLFYGFVVDGEHVFLAAVVLLSDVLGLL